MNENAPASQSRQEDAPTLYTVRHNKQEQKLTLEELVAAAKKGLDYDRIRPSHDFVKKLAAQNGQSDVGRYIAAQGGEEPKKAVGSLPDELSRLLTQCPEALQNGAVTLPEELSGLMAGGMDMVSAYRACELKRARAECDRLRAQMLAKEADFENRMASTGSLAGGGTVEKDFYTPQEWDALPPDAKRALIENGKIYEFMKKWSGNG